MTRILLAALLASTVALAPLSAGPLGILGGRKDKEKEEQQVKAPFQNFHYDKKADWERLKKISVEAVDFKDLPQSPAWKAAAPALSEATLEKDTAALAEGMRKDFCNELSTRASKSWTLVDNPDDETAVLHLSITRLVPPSAASAPAETPSISFEGKLTDKKTGTVIMSFSETQSYSPMPSALWYGTCPQVIAKWAGSFAEMSMPDPAKAEEKSRLRKVARIVGFHFGIRKFMD